MDRRMKVLGWIMAASALWLVGCGGGSSNVVPPPGGGRASTAVLVRDNPPAGTTILTFEITLTSASLNPGPKSLLAAPVRIEVKQFEVESAFLTLAGVDPGQYDSLTVQFSNPEMTIKDASGIKEIKPVLNSSSATFNFNPKLDVAAGTNLGLLIDFDVNASVQNDLSVTPAISASLLPALGQGQVVEELDDVHGKIESTDASNKSFTLRDSATGTVLPPITTNAETEFKDGLTNFDSLKVGQAVEVEIRIQSGGTLFAKEVELEEAENEMDDELEGIIVALPAADQFQMVLNKKTPVTLPVDPGSVITVTMASNTSFRVDNDGFSFSGLNFSGSADLTLGQTVEVDKASGSSNTTPLAKKVVLKKGSLSGQLSSLPSGSDFGLSIASGFPASSITVRTVSGTQFESPLTGLADLKPIGQNLSIRGWLFKTSSGPVLVAKKIRARS